MDSLRRTMMISSAVKHIIWFRVNRFQIQVVPLGLAVRVLRFGFSDTRRV